MVSEREAEVISILSSFLLAVPPSPAGLAKLFLFESRLPEALTDLIRRAPVRHARGLHSQRGQHRQDEHHR